MPEQQGPITVAVARSTVTDAQRRPPRPVSERPIHRLTVDIIPTYKKINDVFYEEKRLKRPRQVGQDGNEKVYNDGFDDEHGNYIVQVGEEIFDRYLIREVLGKGSFGVVVKAFDKRWQEYVAVKIIRNRPHFHAQAKVEIELLTKLTKLTASEHLFEDDHNIIALKKYFSWKGHLCLSFELLSYNLYDLIKLTKFNGVSLNLVRKFGYQVACTLNFLQSLPTPIIHCDIKPENILLKNPKRSMIKVIDFGSSCYMDKKMYKYIQSRFYRAPEVILGLSYNCMIDLWSLGCILVELHVGLPIFDGKNELEQLHKFVSVLGPIPQEMIEASPKKGQMFVQSATGKYTLKPVPTAQANQGSGDPGAAGVMDIVRRAVETKGTRRLGTVGHLQEDYDVFVDLIMRLLHFDPATRAHPREVIMHKFFVASREAQLRDREERLQQQTADRERRSSGQTSRTAPAGATNSEPSNNATADSTQTKPSGSTTATATGQPRRGSSGSTTTTTTTKAVPSVANPAAGPRQSAEKPSTNSTTLPITASAANSSAPKAAKETTPSRYRDVGAL